MLLVILYHSCASWTGNWFDAVEVQQSVRVLQAFPVWLNSFHIYGFTLVSGFIYAYLQEQGHYKSIGGIAGKKFKRLIIPYAFACLAWVVPLSEYFYHCSGSYLINKYALGIAPSQLWFLLMLFDVFILAWLLEPMFKKSIISAVAVGILSYEVCLVGAHLLPNVYQIWMGFEYLPVFVLGYKLWQDDKQSWIQKPILWMVLHTVTFVLIHVMPDAGIVVKISRLGFEFLNHLFGAMMAFTVLQWIAARVNYQKSIVYKTLSKHSMTIYLFHQQIIYFVIWYLNGKVNSVLIAVFNFIISLLLSLAISIFLSKFKVTRFLIGEKA